MRPTRGHRQRRKNGNPSHRPWNTQILSYDRFSFCSGQSEFLLLTTQMREQLCCRDRTQDVPDYKCDLRQITSLWDY